MKVWQSALFFLVIFAGVLFWRRSTVHAPTPARPAGLPEPDPAAAAVLPGSDVSIVLARGALIIEGDIADPIENVRLARADKPDETIAFDSGSATPVKFIGFFNVEAGQHYFAEVKTKHRSIVRQLTQPEKVQPVEIQRIPIHVRAANTAKPNVVFSPDGKLVAISTDTGELKLLPVFGGDVRIEKRPSKGVQSLAFSADGSRLVTLDCGEKTVVHCYGTGIEGEVWSKELDFKRQVDDLAPSRVYVVDSTVWPVYDLGNRLWGTSPLGLRTGGRESRQNKSNLMFEGLSSSCIVRNRILVAGRSLLIKPFFLTFEAIPALTNSSSILFCPDDVNALGDPEYSSQIIATLDGSAALYALTDGFVNCVDVNEDKLVKRWRIDIGPTVSTKEGPTWTNAVSMSALDGKLCVVTGPAINSRSLSSSWDSSNPDACSVHIVDLSDGHRIMKLPISDIPRFCASSSDGRWLAIPTGAGPLIAGEKQKLNLFEFSSSDRSVLPKLVYTYSMKDLGATFSSDGRLLAVVNDSETPANPKDDEKTVDVVIIH